MFRLCNCSDRAQRSPSKAANLTSKFSEAPKFGHRGAQLLPTLISSSKAGLSFLTLLLICVRLAFVCVCVCVSPPIRAHCFLRLYVYVMNFRNHWICVRGGEGGSSRHRPLLPIATPLFPRSRNPAVLTTLSGLGACNIRIHTGRAQRWRI